MTNASPDVPPTADAHGQHQGSAARVLGARPPGRPTADERPGVVYVIGTYPLLTTTFIDREIRELRAEGLRIDVISLRRPRPDLAPDQLALAASTTYARPASPVDLARHHARFLIRRPGPYAATLFRMASGRGQSIRQRLRSVGHFALGVHVAGLLADEPPPRTVHAHFIDRAAAVAYVVGQLLNVPYSVTAHASDIYMSPVLLDVKMEGAAFVATCTSYNREHLASSVPQAADRVVVNYHGLELDRYTAGRPPDSTTPTLISVGQLVEKKGFPDLLDACRILIDRGLSFRCEIVGEGPLRPALEARIRELDLDGVVELQGAVPHSAVIDAYRRACAFVLPCITGEDGSRDGIPNVILEAMAMRLPVVSTRHSGIPEAVEHGVTGLLVPPSDPEALADSLASLLRDPALGRAMGDRGRDVVDEHFDVRKNVRVLHDRFVATGATR